MPNHPRRSSTTSSRVRVGWLAAAVAAVLVIFGVRALVGGQVPSTAGPSSTPSGSSAAAAGPTVPSSTPGGSGAASGSSTDQPTSPGSSATLRPAATPTRAPSSTAPSSTATAHPTTRPTATPRASATPRPTTRPTATPRASATPGPSSTTTTGGLPAFNHVYVVIMENEEATGIIGNANAPYINSLASQGGIATAYTAVAHPSEPNYIALFSGSTHGITDDGTYNLSGKNLADQLEAKGLDWRVYQQNLPDSACFTGSSASGGPDGNGMDGKPGRYARKHNPAIIFTDISGNPSRCSKIQNFSHLDPAAAKYELIVPNLCNDMHDCSVATGDAYLKSFLPTILNSPAMAGSVLFLTWDEGSSGTGGGGKVATIVVGQGVPAGFSSNTPYNHYSLLRTIQDSWGLGCLASSCDAHSMAAFWP